jgi:hypothetical protein
VTRDFLPPQFVANIVDGQLEARVSRGQPCINLIRFRFDIVVTVKIISAGHALDVSSTEQRLDVVFEANESHLRLPGARTEKLRRHITR